MLKPEREEGRKELRDAAGDREEGASGRTNSLQEADAVRDWLLSERELASRHPLSTRSHNARRADWPGLKATARAQRQERL